MPDRLLPTGEDDPEDHNDGYTQDQRHPTLGRQCQHFVLRAERTRVRPLEGRSQRPHSTTGPSFRLPSCTRMPADSQSQTRVARPDPGISRCGLARSCEAVARPQVSCGPRIYLTGEVTPGAGRRPAKPRSAPQIGSHARVLAWQGTITQLGGSEEPLAHATANRRR